MIEAKLEGAVPTRRRLFLQLQYILREGGEGHISRMMRLLA
jgi:hypothetical protein